VNRKNWKKWTKKPHCTQHTAHQPTKKHTTREFIDTHRRTSPIAYQNNYKQTTLCLIKSCTSSKRLQILNFLTEMFYRQQAIEQRYYFPLKWLVFLHYLAKPQIRKLHPYHLHVACYLPTEHNTWQNHHLVKRAILHSENNQPFTPNKTKAEHKPPRW